MQTRRWIVQRSRGSAADRTFCDPHTAGSDRAVLNLQQRRPVPTRIRASPASIISAILFRAGPVASGLIKWIIRAFAGKFTACRRVPGWPAAWRRHAPGPGSRPAALSTGSAALDRDVIGTAVMLLRTARWWRLEILYLSHGTADKHWISRQQLAFHPHATEDNDYQWNQYAHAAYHALTANIKIFEIFRNTDEYSELPDKIGSFVYFQRTSGIIVQHRLSKPDSNWNSYSP